MVAILNPRRHTGKQILTLAAAWCGFPVGLSRGQTFTWTNGPQGNGDNVWIANNNWATNVAPSQTTDTARISGGNGSVIFLRDGIAGSINIGTILLSNDAYDRLEANAAGASVNFGTASLVQYNPGGDHPSAFTLGDFALLATNWQQAAVNRGGLPPLAYLYIAMLDYPAVYWESPSWPEFWDRYFAQFEGMNLSPVPPMPEYLSARGIPEPAIGAGLAWMAGALVWKRRRITPPGSTHPATAATAP
jgi:hypothetical protein